MTPRVVVTTDRPLFPGHLVRGLRAGPGASSSPNLTARRGPSRRRLASRWQRRWVGFTSKSPKAAWPNRYSTSAGHFKCGVKSSKALIRSPIVSILFDNQFVGLQFR